MTFQLPEINLDKIKISSEPLSLYNHLKIHRDEIQPWLKRLEQVESQDRPLLSRALAIEITEFKRACETLFDWIEEAVNQINAMYRDSGRNDVLTPPGDELRNELNNPIFNNIRNARNQIAAHRYTDRNGDYITIGAALSHYNSISKPKLTEAFKITNQCLDEIEQWISENRDYLRLYKDWYEQAAALRRTIYQRRGEFAGDSVQDLRVVREARESGER